MKHIIEILEKLSNGIDITTGEVFDIEKYRDNPQLVSSIRKLQKTFCGNKKVGIYQKYEEEYPEHIIVMKEGYFYSAHNNSAVKLARIMGYSMGKDLWGRDTTGGPDIDKIRQALNYAEYNFIIVEKDSVIYKREGKNPFIKRNTREDLDKKNNSNLTKPQGELLEIKEKHSDKGERTCEECMLLKREECFGEKEICDLFKPSPTVSQEEKERWPTYGDATALKLGERR